MSDAEAMFSQRDDPRHPSTPRTIPAPNPLLVWARRVAATVGVLGVGLLAACGGSDDGDDSDAEAATDTAATEVSVDGTDEAAGDDTGSADDDGTEPVAVSAVQACLDTAGFPTTASSELLSEQQLADQETQFGQIDALTFDATTVEFAGGVHFFSTADQATARGDNFADVAVAIQPVGAALVLIEAGTNFEDAVAAAEGCLS